MNYSDIAQPWQQKTNIERKLPRRSNSPFFFAHFPSNWELHFFETTIKKKSKKGDTEEEEVIIKPLLIPDLHAIFETPGCNGIRDMGKGKGDSTYLKARMSSQQWTILEPNMHDYLRVYPCINGKYHTDKFQTLELLGNEVIETQNKKDFANWKRELVLNGHIKPPHEHIIKKKILELQRNIERKIRSQHIPEIKKKIAILEKDLGIMNELLKNSKKGKDNYEL